jgi:DNA-binding CsgD family transcriptional regulator
VLHIFLAMNIVAFSLGIVVVILGILSYRRSGRLPFQIFALLFTGAILFLLVDTLVLYARAARGVFGGAMPFVAMMLSGAASGLLAYTIPVFAFQLVDRKFTLAGSIVHALVIVAFVALGVLDDLLPSPFLYALQVAAISCLQLYGIYIVVSNFKRIADPTVRSLVRKAIFIALVMIVLTVIERFAKTRPFAPSFIREYGLVELAYCLSAEILLLVYALKYLFKPVTKPKDTLSEHFVLKYGISPREREIITMIVQGYGNRQIGETLFISAMTVKNHIYHIYQKTGVENKIQLLNIINLPE